MAFTYAGTLTTSRDKARFYVGDRTESSGPRPSGGNFTDAEIDAVVTIAGTWQRAVWHLLETLSIEWSQHANITVGPRSQSFAQIAEAFAKRAERWRKEHNIYPPISVAGVIRDDGYSDDEPSDDADTVSEYGEVEIKTWTYPL